MLPDHGSLGYYLLTAIGDITEPIAKVDPRQTPEREIVYLDISSIDNANHRVTEPKHYRGADAPSRARQQVRGGDVLFSTVRTYLENIAVVPDALDGQVASTGFSILRGAVGVSSTYLFYYTLTKGFLDALDVLQRGTSYPAVRDDDVRAQLIPLAPTAEQDRIVAEIEKQFTRLDAGVVALKRAQANLKRYKAAVLKAACEGRLVPQNPSDEPAAALLARILAARRAKWEADLRAKGKNPATARYDDSAAPNTDDLPALPDGWCWALWEQLSPRVTVGHVGPTVDEYVAEGIPFLRSQNVRENRYEPDNLRYISPRFHAALSKSTLHPGDLVVVRSGSVGITCVIPESLGEANCADLVIVQRSNALDSLYGAYYMNSLAKRQVKMGQVGVALIHFNTKSVAALPIAVPPLPEQERIVAEVERRLSVVQEQETVIAHSLTRAERLRQSILARAFAGELVRQDPSDEPASMLLERIRAERTGQSAAPMRRETRQVGSIPMHPRQSIDEVDGKGAVQLTLPVA